MNAAKQGKLRQPPASILCVLPGLSTPCLGRSDCLVWSGWFSISPSYSCFRARSADTASPPTPPLTTTTTEIYLLGFVRFIVRLTLPAASSSICSLESTEGHVFQHWPAWLLRSPFLPGQSHSGVRAPAAAPIYPSAVSLCVSRLWCTCWSVKVSVPLTSSFV